MLKICLAFYKSKPQYAYERYAYKKKHVCRFCVLQVSLYCASLDASKLTQIYRGVAFVHGKQHCLTCLEQRYLF